MLTDKDIEKLTSVLATKQDVIEIKKDVEGLRDSVQGLFSAIDKLVKVIHELRMEYTSMGFQLNRHEQWIMEIANKIGIQLKD